VVASTIGGVIIAISTTLNLLLYGRITGLSGAFNSMIKYDKPSGFDWKTVFFVGLITIPAILNQIFGNKIVRDDGFTFIMFDDNEPIN
jgi:multisubunit Na+/H+ antiporter MnhB subunit